MNNARRNRIAVNVEDTIYEALRSLAEREDISISELSRSLLISGLQNLELLPDATIKRLAGVRTFD